MYRVTVQKDCVYAERLHSLNLKEAVYEKKSGNDQP